MRIALICLLLCGCASTPSAIDVPAPKRQRIDIDSKLLQPCPEKLLDLQPNPKPSDVLAQHAIDAAMYRDCAEAKKSVTDLLLKAISEK